MADSAATRMSVVPTMIPMKNFVVSYVDSNNVCGHSQCFYQHRNIKSPFQIFVVVVVVDYISNVA